MLGRGTHHKEQNDKDFCLSNAIEGHFKADSDRHPCAKLFGRVVEPAAVPQSRSLGQFRTVFT